MSTTPVRFCSTVSALSILCAVSVGAPAFAQDYDAVPGNSAVSVASGKSADGSLSAMRLTFFGGAAKQICAQVKLLPAAQPKIKGGVVCGIDELGVVTASIGANASVETLPAGQAINGAIVSRSYAKAGASLVGVGVKATTKVKVVSQDNGDSVVGRACEALGLDLVSSTNSSAPITHNGVSCHRSANGKELVLEFVVTALGAIKS